MTKEYIKRQITLHKLGLPISEDIKEYYDCFHQLIGDVNNLEELRHDNYHNRIFWRKYDDVILEYDMESEYFWVISTIWDKFKGIFMLSYNSVQKLFSAFIEETLKISIDKIYDSKINKNSFFFNINNE